MYSICGGLKSANHKKDCVRKSHIHKVPHLWKVHKAKKLYKSANLQICDLENLFANHPSLQIALIL
jgi:hypothetical protein